MNKNSLSRKGVFGSLWRWLKGKIASSCKLSLSLPDNTDDKQEKKKIKELVKKIENWDVSYYPEDRINAILELGSIESDNTIHKKRKIKWKNLDDNQKEKVSAKLAGFLNRIVYGDYTGKPYNERDRQQLVRKITDLYDPYSIGTGNAVLNSLIINFYLPKKGEGGECGEEYSKNKAKLTNMTRLLSSKDLWLCMTKNKYDDGMGNKYSKLIRKHAEPSTTTSSWDRDQDLIDGIKKLTTNNNKPSYDDIKKNMYHDKTDVFVDRIREDIQDIRREFVNGYENKKLLKTGIALLCAQIDEKNDKNKVLTLDNWNNYMNNEYMKYKGTNLGDVVPICYFTLDKFGELTTKKCGDKKNWIIIESGFSYPVLSLFVASEDDLPQYVHVHNRDLASEFPNKLLNRAKEKNIKLPDDCKNYIEIDLKKELKK